MKLGIDLGGSHIAIGVVDNEGKILEKEEQRITIKEKENIKKFIEITILNKYKELKQKYEIEKIGIAIPGALTQKAIINAHNLGLKNYNIVEKLEKEIQLPIKIKNDAKCAALAENEYGCLKKSNRNVFLTLGTRNRWSSDNR